MRNDEANNENELASRRPKLGEKNPISYKEKQHEEDARKQLEGEREKDY